MDRRLKPSQGWLVASVGLGGAAAALLYWLWPHAHWAVYAIGGFLMAAMLYSGFLKVAGYERLADRD
ncbi:MAG TPA: hypothetical protein VHG92_06510 [Afifellaceae bacterium]|nr:hypothetical protein [Afifellaceae bacterium]